MSERRTIAALIFIVIGVAVTVAAVIVTMLYTAVFRQRQAELIGRAAAGARLVETVLSDIDARNDFDRRLQAVEENLTEDWRFFGRFGDTGRLSLARRTNGNPAELTWVGNALDSSSDGPAARASLRLPADSGSSGTFIAERAGERTLVAYHPVGTLGLVVVARMALSEILAPFFFAGAAALAVCAAILLVAAIGIRLFGPGLICRHDTGVASLGTLLENLAGGTILLDEKGLVETFSPEAERIFGCRAGEMKGKGIAELLPSAERDLRLYLPGSRSPEPRSRESASGRCATFARRRNGEVFPVELGIGEMSIGGRRLVAILVRDVSERVATEARLREQKERLRDFAKASADWFWETDADLRFTYISANVARILGRSPDFFLGKRREDFRPEGYDREAWRRYADAIRERRPFRDFVHLCTGAGETLRWIRVSGVPVFDATGRFVGYRGACSDVTSAKEAEHALRRAKDAAERAERAKSRFLAAAGHDMRQPLHALGLLVSAIAVRNRDPNLRALIARMEDSLDSFRTMLESLLDMTRLEAGMLKADRRNFPLAPMLRRLAAELSPTAERKGLRLRVARTTGIVHSDPALVERVLRNFLANAIQYTESGGILIGCRRRNDDLEVGVWDTGCGIPQDKLTAIFEEYTRLPHRSASGSQSHVQGQGLGLGLAIVDHIARSLGHPVIVRSAPERGSMFAIRLPRAGVAAPPTETSLQHRRLSTAEPVSGFIDHAAIASSAE